MSHNLRPNSSNDQTAAGRPPSAAPLRFIESYYPAVRLAVRVSDAAVFAAEPIARAIFQTAAAHAELRNVCAQMHAAILEATGAQFPGIEPDQPVAPDAISSNVRAMVQNGITRIASDLLAHRSCLRLANHSAPSDTPAEALALRQMADHSLLRGMRAEAQQRSEFFLEGIDTLRRYLDYSCAQVDASAWFDMGWMLWRTGGGPAEAESAIRLAAELTTDDPAGLYLLCLKHLIHFYCERGSMDDAQAAANIAVQISPTYDVLYEASRCAALAGDEHKAIDLLERCIELVPLTYVCVLSDKDFSEVGAAIRALTQQLSQTAQETAREKLAGWKDALERCAAVEANCQFDIKLPAQLKQNPDILLTDIEDTDFFSCLEIARHAATSRSKVFVFACQALEEETTARSEALRTVVQRITETRKRAEEAKAAARAQMNAAIQEAAKERDSRPRLTVSWSFGLALAATFIGGAVTGSVESGLALFLPALVASVSFTYLLNSSSASLAYTSRANACRRENSIAIGQIENELQKSLRSLEQSAAHLRDLKVQAAQEIAALRSAEAAAQETQEQAPMTATTPESQNERKAA
ncbi:MAG: hypothetical protein IT209_02205 [Armatimonadetes bacterium]|nr:hypothetical protein [Armatimonadota bacterium]